MFITTTRKNGNSLTITIPKELVNSLNLSPGLKYLWEINSQTGHFTLAPIKSSDVFKR